MIYNAELREIKTMYKSHIVGNEPIQEWWDFITTKPKEAVAQVVENMVAVQNRLRDFKNGYYYRTKIRKYVNRCYWTDVEPYEVVEVISNKTVKIRAMDTKQIKFPENVQIGGFAGHYVDNRSGQEYEYISNPDNEIETIRLGKKGWGLGKYTMSDSPYKFYDYNF